MALTISPARSSTVNGKNGIKFTFTYTSSVASWELANGSYTSGANAVYYNQYTRNGAVSNGGKTWTVTVPASMLVSGKNEFTIWYPYYDSYGDYQWVSEDFYLTVRFASLGKPGNPTISQATSSRKITAKWTAASASGGSGSVAYNLVSGDEGEVIWHGTATSTKEINPLSWGTSLKYQVGASYSGLTSTSSNVYFTASKPVLQTRPVLKLAKSRDKNASLSWDDGEYYYADGAAVKFQVYIGKNTTFSSSKLVATVNGSTVSSGTTHLATRSFSTTITEATLLSNGFNKGETLYIAVRPYASASADTTLNQNIPASAYVAFVFGSQGTVKYCADGKSFTECEVYYCSDGKSFTQCEIYYCSDGKTFTQCSS